MTTPKETPMAGVRFTLEESPLRKTRKPMSDNGDIGPLHQHSFGYPKKSPTKDEAIQYENQPEG